MESPAPPRSFPATSPDQTRQLLMAFHSAPIAMAVTTDTGVFVQVNPALAELLGLPGEHLLGRRLEDVAEPEYARAITTGRRQMLAQGLPRHVTDSFLRNAAGHGVPVSLSCAVVPGTEAGGDGSSAHIVVHVLDVTERRAAEAELTHRALHDPLTGLPHRTLLLDRLTLALARLRRHPGTVTVLFCDLDGFKQVNDRYGHTRGDTVLADIARRLQSQQRPGDTVSRFGGDEFVVLCTDTGDDQASAIAARIRAVLAAPIQLGPAAPGTADTTAPTVTVTVSIGVATTSEPDRTAHQLLEAADASMYRDKLAG